MVRKYKTERQNWINSNNFALADVNVSDNKKCLPWLAGDIAYDGNTIKI